MAVIGILGKKSHQTANLLEELFKKAGKLEQFSIIDLEKTKEPMPLNMLVAVDNSENERRVETSEEYFFVMNPDNKEILNCMTKGRQKDLCQPLIITYGFNNKVCVTASSVTESEMQICIQRDIPTLSGGMLEQQEFRITADMEISPEVLLAALTAALIADIEVAVLNPLLVE